MTALWCETALLPDGWARDVRVVFRDGLIDHVQAGAVADAADTRAKIVLAGLANLHSHAFQRAAAGRTGARGAGPDSFWTWRSEIYRLALSLRPEAVRVITALAYAEMLEAGFTRVGEFHYLHHDIDGRAYDDPAEMAGQVVQAAEAVGIDLTLLPVFYAHSDVGGAAPRADQARFVCDLDLYGRLIESCRGHLRGVPGARLGVAPHSLRAVTPAELAALQTLVLDGPIHLHIAEQRAEVARCEAVLGARPVAWLLDHAPVDGRWCLVHATHVTDAEVDRLARSGATVGLCPITEADLGDGIFPAARFVAAGGVYGIGSDSNVLIDVAGELRLLEYGQRLASERRNVLLGAAGSVGRGLWDAAQAGGGRALGEAADGIAVGAPANLIALGDDLVFEGCEGDARLDAWIFAARRPAIDRVWRRGRLVVEDGVHVARPALEAAWRAGLSGVWRKPQP
jgi:formiminoglutamate deiminase